MPQVSEAIEREENDSETYGIIGAAIEVHNQLGSGFLEAVYQEALAFEFSQRGIAFLREVEVPVVYKGRTLACSYKANFICYERVIVELKAISELTAREHAQVINYLRATSYSRALLFNFASSRLQYKRFILSESYPHSSA